ncbi:unnamed protein product [Protopolystoma xenopodis]|uniref:EF-hand domain-containing protein n=1 Tax=Protopolystoma xenopodis TaxID=117903 RepID=A0A3S5CH21_9PLAT|nr:unnamed protein product [Protopolystoma xenopodis]
MPALEKDEIESLFKSLDIDKDGRVSVSELSAVLKGKRNQRASTTTDAKRIIDEHSHGSQQTLSFAEFVKYIHDTETQLKLAFKQLDRNSDNKVDVEEVLLAMKDLGVNISRCDAEQLLKKMDKDGSLTINFEEWRDFLLFSGTSDIKTIFQYWRHASATDIGEIYSIPDDYTEEEKRSGEAWKTLLAGGQFWLLTFIWRSYSRKKLSYS